MKHHKLLPNNTNSLLSWDEYFEIQYRYYSDEILSQYIVFASCPPEIKELQLDRISENTTKTIILSKLRTCGIEAIEKRFNDYYSILQLQDLKEQKEKENYDVNCSIYSSFYPSSLSHGIHRDASDIYHWQHLGYTEWTIYDKETHTYILKPGDCLYIPTGMYHDAVPLTARVGTSFSFYPPEMNNTYTETFFLDKEEKYDYGNEYIRQHIPKNLGEKYKDIVLEN